MKRLQRVLSVVLAGIMLSGMLLTGATAVDFTKSKTYTDGQFTDVSKEWYRDSVKTCYELGLMNGVTDTEFSPKGMFTLAQAVTVAARLHHIYAGGNGVLPNTYAANAPAFASGKWYSNAVGYCIKNGIITRNQFADFGQNATRAEMAAIIFGALPEDVWEPINSVDVLPDVSATTPYAEEIFALYNAGIMSGSDEYGTYQPYAYITRAEVAAVIARCAVPAQRKVLSLTPMSERDAAVIPGSEFGVMSCGRLLFKDPTTGLYGYMDATGKIVIAAQYKAADNFAEGYARVSLNGRDYTLVDTTGKVVLPEGWTVPSDISYTHSYKIKTADGEDALFKNGVFVGRGYYSSFGVDGNSYAPYLSVANGNSYGILSLTGEVLLPVNYSNIFYTGVYAYGKNRETNKYDIYKDGVLICGGADEIKLSYDEKNAGIIYAVRLGNKWALGADRGLLTEALYDDIKVYSNSNLAILQYGSLYGLGGLSGEILGVQYKDVKVYGDFALLRQSDDQGRLADATGLLDSKLSYVDWRYGYVEIYRSGAVKYAEDKYLLPDGTILTGQIDWKLKDSEGRYYALEDDKIYGPYLLTTNYYFYKDLNGKWGVLGQEAVYEDLDDCGHLLTMKQDGLWGLMTRDGVVLREPYSESKINYTSCYSSMSITNLEDGLFLNNDFYPGLSVTGRINSFDYCYSFGSYPNYFTTGYLRPLVNGKPIVIGRGEILIEYYKNSMYYDEIKYLGEDCFACRFNTTWYLIHT